MNAWMRIGALLSALAMADLVQGNPAEVAQRLRAPAGFEVRLLAAVPGARSMVLGSRGTLFVGTMRGGNGNVYAVRDPLGASPEVLTVAKGLRMPSGVAFHDNALYIAEPQRILRIQDVESSLQSPPAPQVVLSDLPYKNVLHAWKFIAFGPDGRLYVPVGAPCNICNEPEFGVILRMNPDGSGREVYARGVRNSVGFAWQPGSGDLWFTDNGRDLMGDDIPACELNHAPRAGLHFGFPYCHGGTVIDPEYGSLGRCEDAVGPVQALGPHVAPLGMRFYDGTQFPPEYRHQVFIAEHGSWNRSKGAGRTGYRVSIVRINGDKAESYETFLSGFVDGETVLGRPVDVLVAPDGSLLVSDDTAGGIYRVQYPRQN